MTKNEILDSLTPDQRAEFDSDIEHLVQRAGIEYDFDSTKVAEVNTNMRLQNGVFLNVTLVFHVDKNRKVTGQITHLKRFSTIDEYLDSINKSKNPEDGFKSIKP